MAAWILDQHKGMVCYEWQDENINTEIFLCLGIWEGFLKFYSFSHELVKMRHFGVVIYLFSNIA